MSSYLLILRRNQSEELGLPQEEMFARFRHYAQSLHQGGALRGVERLKPAAEGTTVRGQNGTTRLDGPYDGAQESVIGYFQVEAADAPAVEAIAKECPILLVGGSVEIREIEPFPKE